MTRWPISPYSALLIFLMGTMAVLATNAGAQRTLLEPMIGAPEATATLVDGESRGAY